MWEGIIARKRSDGLSQSLCEHSRNVDEISLYTSHYPKTSKLLAYLHDLGKLSSEFKNYIEKGGQRGSVIHAWQGAFFVNDLVSDHSTTAKLLKEIIGLCVTAHHNYIDDGVAPDGISDYYNKYSNTNAVKYRYEEIKGKITASVKAEIQAMFDAAVPEISDLLCRINSVYKSRPSANFALGLFIKHLYSCLVDADRLDAYLFEINETYSHKPHSWDPIIDTFERNISCFSQEKEIDAIRKSVSDKCKVAAEKETGIYQLSVPTGGGKTLSSLRFALHHCKKYDKKRIIYVIPYLSIIEQTAANFTKILDLQDDNDILLEHHSNIMEPEDEKSSEIRKLSSARWDRPIVVTTMVQFLESVMSAKSGKLRKFASMADSVIIFDEIQSMPIKAIHCFNEIVTFLSKILNSTIILCSATQPALESTQRENLLIQDEAQLIDCTSDFKDLKRVSISTESEKDFEGAADFILEKANINGNCLVIVNTKKSALKIYHRLGSITADFKIILLSTSICPIHRAKKIEAVKESIANNEKVICVSTQLIEAGVDISFSCVVRAMAGLDSIAQAAGRCNRNGESDVPKTVYTFTLKGEDLDDLKDIKSGKEITEQIIQANKDGLDLLDESIMASFYKRYFSGKDGRMDYTLSRGGLIYGMLSGNEYGKENYKNHTGQQFQHFIPHAFRSADVNFNVIDKNAKSVVVVHEDSKDLIEQYRSYRTEVVTKEKVQILKDLQKYSVSLYEWQLKELDRQGAIDILDMETGVLLLHEFCYSKEEGVKIDAMQKNLIC